MFKKIFLYTTLFLCSCAVSIAQSNEKNAYQEFIQSKPAYKKITITEHDKLWMDKYGQLKKSDMVTSEIVWTNKTVSNTRYDIENDQFPGCKKWAILKIYDRRHKNRVITKEYWCDSLRETKTSFRYNDSTVTINSKGEIIFKSYYDKSINAWVSYSKSPTRTCKYVTTTDSVSNIEFTYYNDSLAYKEITYKHHNTIDSIVVFESNGKLLTKSFHIYNQAGEVLYLDVYFFGRTENFIDCNSYNYVYDIEGNWIERVETNIDGRSITSKKESRKILYK